MAQWMTQADCKAVMHSLLFTELADYRGEVAPTWQGLPEVDSLERLHLAACVSEFFCMHETGMEDRLLMTHSFDEWSYLVAQAITDTSGLSFRTSGSTGAPSSHVHRWAHIEAEAHALAQRLAPVSTMQRVISWLPLHHLYGFMLGVALPGVVGIPRIAVSGAGLPRLSAGDVMVTVPPRWDYLARLSTSWPTEVTGISSTAPIPATTSERLQSHGLTGLLDVYGSTETGGVATRWRHDTPYQLLSHWQRHNDEHIRRVEDKAITPLLDTLQWHDDTTFTLKGRYDDVVSIGGVNVSLAYVTQRLLSLDSVKMCAIRTTDSAAQLRLKAFVVAASGDQAEAATEIAQAVATWPAAERPVSITYGDALPTSEMGKLCDWQVDSLRKFEGGRG